MNGTELRAARLALKLSGDAMAAALGVSRRTLVNLEKSADDLGDKIGARVAELQKGEEAPAAPPAVVEKARARAAAKSPPAADLPPLAPYRGEPPHNVKHVRRPTDEERRAHHYMHGPNVWIQEKPDGSTVIWYGAASGMGDWSHYWPDSKRPAPDFTETGRTPAKPPTPPKGGQRARAA